ncbi:C39 family peptidase [Rhodococcus zopfii]
MEKLLDYDRTIVPQETGYWCGPASVQVVLNSLGIRVAEKDMARELGTTVNGTNWIGSFPQVLNRYADAGYFVVEMPHDPPRAEQKERLWRDLVESINGGRGVIVNIVAPPSNYPRGVKGSQSPRYGGGVVYHYMSVMGYDDAGARAVWIADSGFQPQGYWMAFDQLATLIPPKGYTAAPGPATPAPAPAPAAGLTAETLAAAMGNAVPIDRYRALLPAFSAAMVAAGCTTVERAAMWCAQIGHESQGLGLFRELWGPTPDQLTYDGRMGNGPGDGFRYRGRGAIQVTGRDHYTNFSGWAYERGRVPTRTFFVDRPDALESDEYAFLGAVWYWTTQRPLNELSDACDIAGATRAINGGTNGLADRQLRYQRCLNLGAALLPTTDSEELTVADIERLERFIADFLVGYLGPALSDIKDIREQLTGGRDLVRREDGSVDLAASFPGWPQLGGDTVVDALGIVLQNQVNTALRLDALDGKGTN